MYSHILRRDWRFIAKPWERTIKNQDLALPQKNINTCSKGIHQILFLDIPGEQEIKGPLQERLILASAERKQRRHLVLWGRGLSIDGKNCVVFLLAAVLDGSGERDTEQIG
jgi:hypothetical protein